MVYTKEESTIALRDLREGSIIFFEVISDIRSSVGMGIFTLEEIGTSEKELEELWRKCALYAARSWLSDLRGQIEDPEICIHWIRRNAELGQLTLEEIGTNAKELANYLTVK